MKPRRWDLTLAAFDSLPAGRREAKPEAAKRDAERLADRLLAAWPPDPDDPPPLDLTIPPATGTLRVLTWDYDARDFRAVPGDFQSAVLIQGGGLRLRVSVDRGGGLVVDAQGHGHQGLAYVRLDELQANDIQVRAIVRGSRERHP